MVQINKVIFEFYRHRTRLSDDALKELKRIVDKEFDRRDRANMGRKQLLAAG